MLNLAQVFEQFSVCLTSLYNAHERGDSLQCSVASFDSAVGFPCSIVVHVWEWIIGVVLQRDESQLSLHVRRRIELSSAGGAGNLFGSCPSSS